MNMMSTDSGYKAGARFTKYLMTILQISYNNSTITSNFLNILQKMQGFS